MKHIRLFIFFLLNIIGTKLFAFDISVLNADGKMIYYNWLDNKTALEVTYRSGWVYYSAEDYSGDLVIPDSVSYGGKMYPVNQIGAWAFQGKTALTSVTTGNCVSNIGSEAFKGLKDITVKMGEKVKYIHSWAFDDCVNLKLEFHSQSVPWIYRVDGLTEVVLGDEVQNVVERAFENCKGLTIITFGKGLASISSSAFSGCKALQKIIVKDIAAWCNAEHNNTWSNVVLYSDENSVFENIIIPDGVKSIAKNAFKNIKGIKNVVIPNTVISIGTYAFCGNSDLISITLPNSIVSIGNDAFKDCSNLISVTIPNSVTSIGERAFFNTNLKSITIGSGVQNLGETVFYNYRQGGNRPLKVIWLTNTPPDGYNSDAKGIMNYAANDAYGTSYNTKVYPFLSSIFEVDGIKYVPVNPSERTCDAIDCVYNESAETISIEKIVSFKGIDMIVKNINQYLCDGNPFIKDVNLSFDTDINDYTFQGCTNIINATIKSTGNIGKYAFANCSALKTVSLGQKITSIKQHAFDGCKELQNIVIPDAVISVGDYSFQNCDNMTSAKIGKGMTAINEYTFSGCSSLIDIQIGSNITTIGSSAFSNCSSLLKIHIPQSVIEIKSYAFMGCEKLKDFIMEDKQTDNTVLSLGSNGSSSLFVDCPLDSVYIGRKISYDTSNNGGYSPFYRNTSLRSVTITDKETEISTNEFYGCTNLKKVSIGDGVTNIGDWAFSGCSSLDYFAFGSSVKTIGKEAFSDCTAMTKLISRAVTPPTCGSQALDDINKWNCTLSVPTGAITAYQQADQWKEFFFINNDITGISKLTNNIASPNNIYDLNGQKRQNTKPGLNIIKMCDGNTKKVLVK